MVTHSVALLPFWRVPLKAQGVMFDAVWPSDHIRQFRLEIAKTASGAEIDMVIRMPPSEIWAVEIKNGPAPKLDSYYSAICDDVRTNRK
jgi:hypothetical protein